MMNWIFLLFPWLELWTLIQLGIETSALTALAWVFGTLVLGIGMIRRRGLQMIQQIQRDSEGGLVTQRFLGDDLAVVTSGLLLMVPGLITDCLALLVLIGPLRRWLSHWGPVRHRTEAHFTVKSRSGETRSGQTRSGETRSGETRSGETRSGETRSGETRSGSKTQDNVTIEGDYRRLDD